eukprot:scaffold3223_cov36-Prasinocladus_malaysianus.AAC.1
MSRNERPAERPTVQLQFHERWQSDMRPNPSRIQARSRHSCWTLMASAATATVPALLLLLCVVASCPAVFVLVVASSLSTVGTSAAGITQEAVVRRTALRSTDIVFHVGKAALSRRGLLEPAAGGKVPGASAKGVYQWVVALPGPIHHADVERLERQLEARNATVTGFLGGGAFLVAGPSDLRNHLAAINEIDAVVSSPLKYLQPCEGKA